jgi:putative transposase
VHAFIEEYCGKVKGVHFKGIGGTETHVHLAFQMEPFVLLSDFIGKVKGANSHEMNKAWGSGAIRWQRGYGVVSFSGKFLPGILQYVWKQKEHHRNGTTNQVLETYMTEGEEEEEEGQEND